MSKIRRPRPSWAEGANPKPLLETANGFGNTSFITLRLLNRETIETATHVVNVLGQTVGHGLGLHEEPVVLVGRLGQAHLVGLLGDGLHVGHDGVGLLQGDLGVVLLEILR